MGQSCRTAANGQMIGALLAYACPLDAERARRLQVDDELELVGWSTGRSAGLIKKAIEEYNACRETSGRSDRAASVLRTVPPIRYHNPAVATAAITGCRRAQ
jgi:hypothetical protein